jgi:hypothetical protein
VITQKIKRDGPVHGAAIDIRIPKFTGQLAGERTFSAAGPAVYRNRYLGNRRHKSGYCFLQKCIKNNYE